MRARQTPVQGILSGVDAHFVRSRRRFLDLIDAKYFDECRIYRVIPGFIHQWGIPKSPTEYKKWGDNKIKDDPVKVSNSKGTLSFATSGPDARGSQLFVNLGNNKDLDDQGFSPFAEVTAGFELFNGCAEAKSKVDQQSGKERGNDYFSQFPELSYWKSAVRK